MTILALSPPRTAAPMIPRVPGSWDDLGVPQSLVAAIVLKLLYFNTSLQGREIAERTCVPWPLVSEVLKGLSDQASVQSMGFRQGLGKVQLLPGEDIGAAMTYEIATSGRARARELNEINQYIGPVPVPFDAYAAAARQDSLREHDVSLDDLRAALAHLTLGEDTLLTLGPAVNERHTLFIYGAPGNGKTSIAEALCRLTGPPLFVPHALFVHGAVIRYLDPVHHLPHPADLPAHDRRWVLVERPAVIVGGELTPEMLDLGYDRTLGYYEASTQMKANGGLFLVDDFGRQAALSPQGFFNRLIVPLERGYDHLTLARAGTSVSVPFATMLVLSSNLDPTQLVDEAFLRRLHFKVAVPGPTDAEFRAIWEHACAAAGIEYNDGAIDYLIHQWYLRHDPPRPFRGVHPRDILKHITHAARFRRRPARLDRDLVDAACAAYFLMSGAEERA
jgi:predicted ATPase with chaperone activity